MTYKGIEIIPTESKHIPHFWKILQEYPNYFSDEVNIQNEEDFYIWFDENVKDSLTAIKDNNIIGCSYLNDIHDSFGSLNVFVKKRSVRPWITALVAKKIVKYFIKKHGLKMAYGVVRKDNRACIRLFQAIGMKITGTLKNHKKVNGVLTDYIMSSILKEQVI